MHISSIDVVFRIAFRIADQKHQFRINNMLYDQIVSSININDQGTSEQSRTFHIQTEPQERMKKPAKTARQCWSLKSKQQRQLCNFNVE